MTEIKNMFESDEGKAALQQAVDDATQGLKSKRDELLEANRRLKAELSDRQGEIAKMSNRLGKSEATVQTLLVDNGLTEALSRAKVAPEFLDAARALIKAREEVALGEHDGRPVALIGDRPIASFVEDWSRSPEGRPFIAPAASAGGGATGGAGGAGIEVNPWSRGTRNLAEQARLLRDDPDQARRLQHEARRQG